jgi:hypothetical protein
MEMIWRIRMGDRHRTNRVGALVAVILVWLVAGLAAGGVTQAQADGPTDVTEVIASSSQPMRQIATDERRYVAYLDATTRMPRVWDTWTGAIRTIEGAADCAPRDVGGDRVLLECPPGETIIDFIDHVPSDQQDSGYRARTASVLGGPSVPLPDSKWIATAYEIGRYWVRYEPFCFSSSGSSCSELSVPAYFENWRTGKGRSIWPHPGDYRSRNLDSARLAPYRAPFKIKTFGNKLFKKYTYPTMCWNDRVLAAYGGKQLVLFYSKKKWVKLGRTDEIGFNCYGTMSVRVGRPWVTWSHGDRVRAFNYRTGQRFNRRFESDEALIAPIRGGVVIAEPTGGQDGSQRYLIKLIRLG